MIRNKILPLAFILLTGCASVDTFVPQNYQRNTPLMPGDQVQGCANLDNKVNYQYKCTIPTN